MTGQRVLQFQQERVPIKSSGGTGHWGNHTDNCPQLRVRLRWSHRQLCIHICVCSLFGSDFVCVCVCVCVRARASSASWYETQAFSQSNGPEADRYSFFLTPAAATPLLLPPPTKKRFREHAVNWGKKKRVGVLVTAQSREKYFLNAHSTS